MKALSAVLSFAAITLISSQPLKAADTATFVYSGECFWCTEADTEKLDGVVEVISGFTAGTTENPRYYPGEWGDHREAAQVIYDPAVISYPDLVRHVFATIDYEDGSGQFCDRGHSYSPAIYYKTEEERAIAASLAPGSSVVPIEEESRFYPVREAHQDYYKKNSFRYNIYRLGCGRDSRIDELGSK